MARTTVLAVVITAIVVGAVVGSAVFFIGGAAPARPVTTTVTAAPLTLTTTVTAAAAPAAKKVFRIGLGDISVEGQAWDTQVREGIKGAIAKLSKQFPEIEFKLDITSGLAAADALRVYRGYASAGYNMIIDTSGPSHEQSVKQVASENPRIWFVITPPVEPLKQNNTGGWVPDPFDAYYPVGILAAGASKTGRIGAVWPFDFWYTARVHNALLAGTRSFNPDAKIFYSFSGDWPDAVKGAQAAEAVRGKGVDVIVSMGDGQAEGAISKASSLGVPTFGYGVDMNKIYPQSIASVVWNHEKAMTALISMAVTGTLGGQTLVLGIREGGIDLVFNDANKGKVDPKAWTLAKETIDGIKVGKIVVKYVDTFPAQPS